MICLSERITPVNDSPRKIPVVPVFRPLADETVLNVVPEVTSPADMDEISSSADLCLPTNASNRSLSACRCPSKEKFEKSIADSNEASCVLQNGVHQSPSATLVRGRQNYIRRSSSFSPSTSHGDSIEDHRMKLKVPREGGLPPKKSSGGIGPLPSFASMLKALPILLQAFALKVGYHAPSQEHRDAMVFIYKNKE